MTRAGLFLPLILMVPGCGPAPSQGPAQNEVAAQKPSVLPDAPDAMPAASAPLSDETPDEDKAWRVNHLKQTEQAYKAATTIDALLAFDDPSQCAAGPALRHLIGSLGDWRDDMPQPGELPTVPKIGMIGAVNFEKHEGGLTAHVAMTGAWHGLDVTGLDITYWNGGDPAALSILIRASKDKTRAMLNGLDFKLPPNGEIIRANDAAYDTHIELISRGDETRLNCSVS